MIRIRPRTLPLSHLETGPVDRTTTADQAVILHVCERLGPGPRFAVEFGARDGRWGLQIRELIDSLDYGALLIEGDPEMASHLRSRFADSPRITAVESFITAENIESLFRDHGVPEDFEFLLIDIDGNDWHVWKAIERFRPRIVCIEYNPGFPPPERFVIEYDPEFGWSGDDYYGASFTSLVELARERRYRLIHVSANGDNLYFASEEWADVFDSAPPNREADWYQVPQYGVRGRAPNGKGHPISHRNTTPWRRLRATLRWLLLSPARSIHRSLEKRRRRP